VGGIGYQIKKPKVTPVDIAKEYGQQPEEESGFTCFINCERYNPCCFANCATINIDSG
jgi:hypothetical protein